MTARTTGRSISAWLTGAALLCTLSSAQWSHAAQQLGAQPNAIRQQLSQAGQPAPAAAPKPAPAPPKPQPKPQSPAAPAVAPPPRPVSQKAPAPASKAPAKADAKSVEKPADKNAKPVAAHEGSRRDPFSALVGGPTNAGAIPANLPPGKAGLVISLLRVDGIVKGPSGMIAVVSNAQQRVYFLREGDQLYDGAVEKITMNYVSFHEAGKDPFGKPVEREVTKPLNATPGELQ
jgi:hypothetical protein